MLALGNRAGCIEFFRCVYGGLVFCWKCVHLIVCRFNRNSNSGGFLSHIHTEPLSDHWITHLSWTPWITHTVGHCKLSRAYRMNGIFIMAKVNPYWPSPLTTGASEWSKSHKICSLLQTLVLCPSTWPVLYLKFKVQYAKLINEA